MRFTRVDLPTLGRPTTATTGGTASSCSRPAPSWERPVSYPWSSAPSGIVSKSVTVFSVLGSPRGEPLVHKPHHRVDDLVEPQLGRVDLHGVVGLGQG